jgi:hypothetical protein
MRTLTAPVLLSLLMALFLLVASGCSQPPEKVIVATWTLDGAATVPLLNQGPQQSEHVAAVGMMTHTYTFNADNTVAIAYSYGMDSWERTGTWSMGNVDGNNVYFRVEPGEGADWSAYSVRLRGTELSAPLPGIDGQSGIFAR